MDYSQMNLRFDGADYQPIRDNHRLTSQLARVFECMRDAQWRTLGQVSEMTGDPEASVSAQLRHLRKDRFGAHTVERQYIGNGLYEYRLLINRSNTCQQEN